MNAEALGPIVTDALALARAWQDRANDLLTDEEKAIQAQMQRLMDHPMDKVVLTRMIDNNPHLWTPGIKYGVSPGGFTHMTEFFGPLLAVMKAKDLEHAVALVNQTGYGLTSGLESLDRREQKRWKETVRAGNLYINRGTTGAVVLRQPFGGMGKSATSTCAARTTSCATCRWAGW
jgi:acyl-CoA reductase-like NAD-dependent aldehyde dehydrogenase